MRGATGSKTRKIYAISANNSDLFDFNKSIVPRGGRLSKIKFRQRRNGSYFIKTFQDTNDDVRVSKRELTYKGKSRDGLENDILTNFLGRFD